MPRLWLAAAGLWLLLFLGAYRQEPPSPPTAQVCAGPVAIADGPSGVGGRTAACSRTEDSAAPAALGGS